MSKCFVGLLSSLLSLAIGFPGEVCWYWSLGRNVGGEDRSNLLEVRKEGGVPQKVICYRDEDETQGLDLELALDKRRDR